MAEYWLISAPGDKTPQQTYVNLKAQMTGLSPVFQLNLPELKVGDVILLFILLLLFEYGGLSAKSGDHTKLVLLINEVTLKNIKLKGQLHCMCK